MKDRQPTQVLSNGAIRYGFYNADGTLNHYEYLKRDDAPTEEGTPLNKANLLSDATAAKIWPNASTRPEDPTVSEALAELQKGTVKVGDILMTVRAKPSDAWLLCDGQKITRADYPELFDLLRSTAAPGDWTNQTVTGIDRNTSTLNYINGQWMCFNTDPDEPIRIYTSNDAHAWSVHAVQCVDSSGVSRSGTIQAICYSNIDDAYYLLLYYSSKIHVYKLNASLSTLTDLTTTTAGIESNRFGFWSAGWERPDGSICFAIIMYDANPWVTQANSKYTIQSKTYILTNHGKTITVAGACDGIDYNPDSDQFLLMVGRKVYTNSQPGYSDTATLIGEVPTSILPTNDANDGFIPFICATTGTIVVVWGHGRLKYAYSINKGATWIAGPADIQNAENPSETYDYFTPWSGWTFIDGRLIFQVTMEESNDSITKHNYTCSISDPADKVYKDQGKYIAQLNSSALAITSPTFDSSSQIASVYVRDYGNPAKAVPTITPDSRSHAYIKALEE